MFVGPWDHYADIPELHFTLLLERFRMYYYWPPHMKVDVLLVFQHTVMNRYPDMMRDVHQRAIQWALDIKGAMFDNRDYKVWNIDAFRYISRANTTNRATKYEGMTSRNTCGSINTAQHQDRMREAWGREPTVGDVFERTHCSNMKLVPDATIPPMDPAIYVYPKAAHATGTYSRIREEEYLDLDPDTIPPNDAEWWERSVEG